MGGKTVFVVTSALALTVIFGVHYQQTYDKNVMHQGVIRDKERRRLKKLQQEEATGKQ